MKKPLTTIAFCLGIVGAANVASAQTVEPLCFETANDCNARFPGEYEATAAANHPTEACTAPTHVTTRRTCDASRLRRRVCGPPVVTPGASPNSIVVTCGEGAPRVSRPVHARPSPRLVIVCLPDTGIQPNASGNGCEPLPGLTDVHIVRVSVERANGRLVEEQRLASGAIQMTFMGVRFANGAGGPIDDPNLARDLRTFLDGQEERERLQGQRDDGQDAELESIHNELARPSTAESATRVGLGVSYMHYRVFGGSDLDGVGLTGSLWRHRRNRPVGFLLRASIGPGFQPLVPGDGPLWHATGHALLNINLIGELLQLNVGATAGTMWRFGRANSVGQVAGSTAWWAAGVLGLDMNFSVNSDDPNASRVNVGVEGTAGVAQTQAVVGTIVVPPVLAVPVGFNLRVAWVW